MHSKMTPLAIVLMGCAPMATTAQDLLALPGDGGLAMWNTGVEAPIAQFNGVAGGVAGTCYSYSAASGSLSSARDAVGCLDYLVLPAETLNVSQDPYAITGVVTFMSDPISDFYKGFEVTGVTGIDYCGEREDCDRIFIQGVTSPDLLAPLVAAAQSGATVSVTGPAIWNLESIDIVIDGIR